MEVAATIARAQSAANQGIRYKLGKGEMNPGSPTPAAGNQCDCTGFIAWCLGFSRRLEDQFYKNFNNGWFETTAVWTDIGVNTGIMDPLNAPRPGAVVVFPDHNGHQGHIGLVTAVSSGNRISKIIHCSKGNDNQFQDAIKETGPQVFNTPNARLGWFVGLH